jgi:hypothetical protein
VSRQWIVDSCSRNRWLPEGPYVIQDPERPEFDFAGTRAQRGGAADRGGGRGRRSRAGGAGVSSEVKEGGGAVFESLHFLRLAGFEYPSEDCKVRRRSIHRHACVDTCAHVRISFRACMLP